MPVPSDDARLSSVTEAIPGDWPKTAILPDPHIDNLMSALLHLGAEHWMLRRRMLAVEKLLDKGQLIEAAQVDSYMPDATERQAWAVERDAFIDRVFGVLLRETDPAAGHGRFSHES